MRRLAAPLLVPLVALVLGAACTDLAADAPCGSDRACGGGLVCAFGACLDPLDQRLTTVDVEVDPGAGSGLPVQNVLQVNLSTTPRVDVALRPGVSVRGSVTAGEAPLAANVLLRPALSIPGRALAPLSSTDGTGQFSVGALDGARYAVTVNPSEPARAPYYAHDDEPFLVAGDDGSFDLPPLELPDVGPLVRGRVVAGAGVSASGIPALAVHIERTDGRRLSSMATTDATGAFEVALAEPMADVTLVVTPTGDNSSYPVVAVPGLTLVDGDNPLGDVELGDVLAPVPFTATVVDGTGAPVPRARLMLRALVGNGLFELSATADGQGVFDLSLVPATYDALVLGSPDAPAAGMLATPALEVPVPPGSPVVFRLPERLQVAGTVLDEYRDAVANAKVTLVRIGDVDGLPEELLGELLVSFEAETDAGGRWQAGVDPGRYRVSTRPPPSSIAPAFSEIVTFAPDRSGHDVELPPRAIVAGTVLFEGAPQDGAWVRVFSALLDERGAAILVGEGMAGADGAFEIGVPDLVADVTNPNPP
ncbi:MAG: hypothetical protein A2138_11210 [Deltaproteobacteria bacterium RBG_16_71_12]|nr:MAG: hypothetical protein A2138_11210 [Deltaproteobacteria bacterium RBG_16_71_12]